VAEFKSKRGFTQKGVDDLVMLPKITEQEIVDNLHKRYQNDAVYTNIGPVLIVINPYKDLGLTTDEYVRLYRGKFRHELPPHIFALAEETYRAMKGDKTDQCVIISGESGAGKTVAAKHIMQYIAAVSGNSEKVQYIKSVILDSNPLLEAFGNAKTIRNNNSSRFGKYFEINFDAKGDPIGGKVSNYLLEKSRVVYQQAGERNFHIFYQLLAGADSSMQKKLSLYQPQDYFYMNQSGCFTVDEVDDAADFKEVVNAMNTIGITPQDQESIFRIVAGVLHLGNVQFGEDDRGNAYITDRSVLELAASLLQVPPENLEYSVLFRQMTSGTGTRTETFESPLNPVQANGTRNAIARDIYDRMFSWLVEKVNEALDRWKLPKVCVIGILDIFGFEIFEHNGFEQFCINYVNEKLQQYFIEKTLKEEQEEYVAEGIQWTPIKYFNNKIVCELIEGKQPPGLFSLLDDICATIHAQSEGTDEKFLQKAEGLHGSHQHFRGFTGAFAIKHYAGDVAYDAQGFTDKNKDQLFQECIDCMRCSKNQYITRLFPVTAEEKAVQASGQKKRPTTAGFKIKSSANLLMTTLSQCTPHYIRCIKPNDLKKANNWDHERVRHQVQYLGLLENVKVRRAGFAFRAPFDRFLMRYKKLSNKTWGTWGEWKGDAKEGCQQILSGLTSIEPGQWQFGLTKVFVRHPESVFHLEELLERKDFDLIVLIQKSYKVYRARKKALEMRADAAELLKGKKERQRNSVDRKWTGDYINYDDNAPLQEVMDPYKDELVIFADQVLRLNKNGKVEPRFFLLTETAFYVVMRAVKKKQVIWSVTRRAMVNTMTSVSVSTLSDNYVVLHTPAESDTVIECDKKTELIMLLREVFKNTAKRDLMVNFNDNINYKAKEGEKDKTLQFYIDPMAIPLIQQQETMKAKMSSFFGGSALMRIGVLSGLPRDTDSTPRGYSRTPANVVRAPAQKKAANPLAALGGAGASYSGMAPAAGRAAGPGSSSAPAPAPGARPGQQARAPAPAPAPEETGEEAGAEEEAPAPAPAMPVRQANPMAAAAAARGAGARAAPTPASAGRTGASPTPVARPAATAGAGRAAGAGAGTSPAPVARPAVTAGAGAGRAAGATGATAGAGRAAGATAGAAGARPVPSAPARPAAAAAAKPTAVALYDYDAATEDELSFHEGDVLVIHQKDPGGWVEAELNGVRAWAPANYLEFK
jgi:myosin-1